MSAAKGEIFMEIIIKIFGFLFAALMIYGGFKMLLRSQYQTYKSNLSDEDKNKERLDSNNKKDS